MRKALLYIFLHFFFVCQSSSDIVIRVGIWNQAANTQCIMLLQGAHALAQADSVILGWNDIQVYTIIADGDSLSVLEDGKLCIRASRLKVSLPPDSKFRIRLSEGSQERSFRGCMEFHARSGKMSMINETDLDTYIGGVVEAEAGPRLPPEFYKVQALITRTYVLGHLRRHESEGFNVCDKEHCQVFRGISSKSADIPEAVNATSNLVLGDSAGAFIQATFFSNCGGYTVNSEEVWEKRVSYLRAVKDTFCLRSRSARWKKELSDDEYFSCMRRCCRDYEKHDDVLSKEGGVLMNNLRSAVLQAGKCYVPYKRIREELKLKSAFFTATNRNGKLLLEGRGFGHGVGLCQEGAIEMSRRGFKYDQILHYYYRNVNILHLSKMDVFAIPEDF
jgi:stage II sporulation protein D